MFARVMFGKKGQELLNVILAIFVIKVDNKSDRSDGEYLHLFGLTINLKVSD